MSNFSTQKLAVTGINGALFQGSFVITAYATVKSASGEPTEYYLGHHSVLGSWNVVANANHLIHQEIGAHFSLSSVPVGEVDRAEYRLEIQHRGAELPADLSYKLEVID